MNLSLRTPTPLITVLLSPMSREPGSLMYATDASGHMTAEMWGVPSTSDDLVSVLDSIMSALLWRLDQESALPKGNWTVSFSISSDTKRLVSLESRIGSLTGVGFSKTSTVLSSSVMETAQE